MEPDSIVEASASELVVAVRARKISACSMVRAFLDRTDRLESRLNCYVTRTDEFALAAAYEVDRRIAEGLDPGALAGLPISVKDLIAVGGVRQTFGSHLFASNIAAEDAPSVARLRAAGACITGKTTTSELGGKAVGDSPLTGITRNPWDTARTPGGSSAGAAAGVAARMVPIALGTDGGGSIRIPASFCGLVGLKAQFGRVPVWPPSATPTVGHVAPMARTVRDAVLLLSVISGHDVRDAGSLDRPVPDYQGALNLDDLTGLRIGWCPDFGYGHVDAAVLDVCGQAVRSLERAGVLIVTTAPPFAQDPAPAWNAAFYAGISARLAQQGPWEQVESRIDPALRAAAIAARAQSPESMRDADRLREQVLHEVQTLFGGIDILATPTMPVTAPRVGVDVPAGHEGRSAVDWSYFTYPFNLTGNPAMSMPVGVDGAGMPIGLQLVAPAYAETTLLRTAAALERCHPFIGRPGAGAS